MRTGTSRPPAAFRSRGDIQLVSFRILAPFEPFSQSVSQSLTHSLTQSLIRGPTHSPCGPPLGTGGGGGHPEKAPHPPSPRPRPFGCTSLQVSLACDACGADRFRYVLWCFAFPLPTTAGQFRRGIQQRNQNLQNVPAWVACPLRPCGLAMGAHTRNDKGFKRAKDIWN